MLPGRGRQRPERHHPLHLCICRPYPPRLSVAPPSMLHSVQRALPLNWSALAICQSTTLTVRHAEWKKRNTRQQKTKSRKTKGQPVITEKAPGAAQTTPSCVNWKTRSSTNTGQLDAQNFITCPTQQHFGHEWSYGLQIQSDTNNEIDMQCKLINEYTSSYVIHFYPSSQLL